MNDSYAFPAEAITEVSLCRFPRLKLEALLDKFPKMERRLLGMASNELAAAQDQMILLGRKTAEEKVASFLVLLSRRATERGQPAAAYPRHGLADHRARRAAAAGAQHQFGRQQLNLLPHGRPGDPVEQPGASSLPEQAHRLVDGGRGGERSRCLRRGLRRDSRKSRRLGVGDGVDPGCGPGRPGDEVPAIRAGADRLVDDGRGGDGICRACSPDLGNTAGGQPDVQGREMRSTVSAVADELASAADLLGAKVTQRPVVLVRGYRPLSPRPDHDRGASAIVMPPEQDLFR